MNTKTETKSWIHRLLIIFIALNIVGDLGNVAFWYASPSSQGSLMGSIIHDLAIGSVT